MARSLSERHPGKEGSEADEDLGAPAMERRREKTFRGWVRGWREDAVRCHAAALALAMAEEAAREAER